MELKTIAYSSTVSRELTSQEIEQILSSCRVYNGLDGVTGILVYNGAAFVQILEGSPPAIADTLARIRRDPRHQDLVVHDDRAITERNFPNWDMAYLQTEEGAYLGGEALERALQRPVPDPVLRLLQEISANRLSLRPDRRSAAL